MNYRTTNTDKRKWLEILAVILTGVLKYILMDWLELRIFYISSACLFWLLYILKRYHQDRQILQEWGFRKEGFQKTFIYCFPLALFALIAIIGSGVAFSSEFLQWGLLPVLVLYPLWGVIQQYLMIGLIAGNLRSISSLSLKEKQVALLVSVLFAFAHSPDWLLMTFTFVMELFFIAAYFRWRNLWTLGLLHGWLGGVFLYFVMQRDLWKELWIIF
jgi:hypothetical protein